MAQRKGQSAKQALPRVRTPARSSGRAEPKSIDDWRQECDRLRAELEAAHTEMAALRARQEQVLNRIDWVLDSLDSLAQTES